MNLIQVLRTIRARAAAFDDLNPKHGLITEDILADLWRLSAEFDFLLKIMSPDSLQNTESFLWNTLCSFSKLIESKFGLRGIGLGFRQLFLRLIQTACQIDIYRSPVKTFICELMSEIRKKVSDRLSGIEAYSKFQPDCRVLLELAVDLQIFRKNIQAQPYSNARGKLFTMPEEISEGNSLNQTQTLSRSGRLRVHSLSNLKYSLSACSGTGSFHQPLSPALPPKAHLSQNSR